MQEEEQFTNRFSVNEFGRESKNESKEGIIESTFCLKLYNKFTFYTFQNV